MNFLSENNQLFASEASKPWDFPEVNFEISENILYIPIASDNVKKVKLNIKNEKFIDLLEVNNPRIKPISVIDTKYKNTYDGYSKVRSGLYKKLLKMLEFLPNNIGIAYFEGLRPLWKQKEYFDKKFLEILKNTQNKEIAYYETTKHVSPFIDNIPTHATGAAIDITLFVQNENDINLMDMGMFDTIYGHNDQQETFSKRTTQKQRENRLLLLNAAIKSDLVNYGFEWWHYSYGDNAWAYVKKKESIYGLAVDKNENILLMSKESYLNKIISTDNFK
ncbi:M15 family metallopeptidase [Lyticum sinuosum]|nr:M15 family metallopeptidase [Lyticum sinuosum]